MVEKARKKGLKVARKKSVMFRILGDLLGCPFFIWGRFQINQGGPLAEDIQIISNNISNEWELRY